MLHFIIDICSELGVDYSTLTNEQRVGLTNIVASAILAGAHDSRLVEKAMTVTADEVFRLTDR